jgi:hypothetical protein
MRLFSCFFLVATASLIGIAQPEVPQDYFRSPVDIPIVLSGTFGEPRSTDFHSGLDIKTQGREGLKIYAIADGYISRIKISPWGFGHALYIKHPNGYESVYAHLSAYRDDIADLARSVQYEQRSFEIEYYPEPGAYPVNKGEAIAYSGNSGSSGGPHLHFEIRDSLERPYNPLLFGYDVPDTRPPAIHNLAFYRMDRLRFLSDSEILTASASGSHYIVNGGGLIKVNTDKLGLGVHTYDQLNGASNKNGVYAIELLDGEELIYQYRMDRLAFTETRYVHCHMDAKERDKNGRSIHRCYKLPGDELSVYAQTLNDGVVDISDGGVHDLTIKVFDFKGNTSTLKLKVQKDDAASFFNVGSLTYDQILSHKTDNLVETEGFILDVPAGILFDTLHLSYKQKTATSNAILSSVFTIGDEYVPAFDWFNLALAYDVRKYQVEPSKVLLVVKDHKGRVKGRGGYYEGGMIHGEVREFGQFYLLSDTTPPVITPLDIYDGKNLPGQSAINFAVTDNLSGLDTFYATIDGEWALLEYDPKRNKLTHKFEPNLKQGLHKLVIEVYDERQNNSTYSINFKR